MLTTMMHILVLVKYSFKFGIESKDEVRLIISRERYENYITPLIEDQANVKLSTRPKSGDLFGSLLTIVSMRSRILNMQNHIINYKISMFMNCIANSSVWKMRLSLLVSMILIITLSVKNMMDLLMTVSTPFSGITQTLTMVGSGVTATATASYL